MQEKKMVISCQKICPRAMHLETRNFSITFLHLLSHGSSLEHDLRVRGEKNMALSDKNVRVMTAGQAWPSWFPLPLPSISINAMQVNECAWNELKQTGQREWPSFQRVVLF